MAAIRHLRPLAVLCFLSACLFASCRSENQQPVVNVAVAANFTEAGKEIANRFEQQSGSKPVLSFGSTAQLFTQIMQDAPFEVFLSADAETARKAVDRGFGDTESLFTYAIGKIVLFSTTLDLTNGETTLREGKFEKIAIANPSLAPYGVAAMEAMKALGLDTKLAGRFVMGNNITQTFQFVETGNAEVGFVALSQVVGKTPSSMWIVPQTLYSPIRQDAVLLKKGMHNETARAFMSFLKSPEAVGIIEKYGYAAPH